MQEINYQSKLFYKNLHPNHTGLPSENTKAFTDLVDWEEEKCTSGINVNGLYIPGTLYYFLNHHYIDYDVLNPRTNTIDTVIKLPILRDNDWILHNAYNECVKDFESLSIGGARQISKELADYEPLIYEDGEKPIGSCKVGDKIYGRDGKLTTITGVFPQGVKPIYRLHLLDGRYEDCGEEHLWEVYKRKKTKHIKTTRELINSKLTRPHKKSGVNYEYYLPEIEPVEFSKKHLPVDPYLLGYLIGNGGLTTGSLSLNTIDNEVLERFQDSMSDYNFTPCPYLHNGILKDCRYVIKYVGVNKLKYNQNPFKKIITSLKLNVKSENKFIPTEYKYSSVEQRFEILRGLLDSDGHINKEFSIEFKSKSEKLTDDLIWICRSLGIRCQKGIFNYKGSRYYRAYIRTNKDVFFISRKRNLINKKERDDKVAITKIEYLKNHSATCIQVDNTESLFLTKDFIPTHNTTFLVAISCYNLYFKENSEVLGMFATNNDKQTFTKKLQIANQNNTPFLKIPNIDNDYSKDLIRYGFKTVTNEDRVYSKIYLYLTLEGKNIQAASGKSPTFFFFDEIAKHPFIDVNEALIPAVRNQLPGFENKLKCSGLYAFTGGETEKAQDAKKLFYNPKSYFCKEFDEDKTGLFIPGNYRSNLKIESTLGEFLKSKGYSKLTDEIENEKMLVVNKEIADKQLDKEEEEARSTSQKAFIDRRTFNPRKKEHMFNGGSTNMFSHLSEELEKLYHYLTHEEQDLRKIEFDKSGIKDSEKHLLVEELNNPKDYELDTAIALRVMPKYGNTSLYVKGLDPTNVDKTTSSVSLTSFYIMQKDTEDINDPNNSRIVAWFNGRKDIRHTRNQTLLTLEFFGASRGNITLLHEAADDNTTQWFDEQNKGHYLTNTFNLSKEINPNSNSYNTKGLRPTPKNQSYYLGLILNYLEEELEDGRLGLWRIPDPYLVNQLINFEGKLGDKDAIVAFGHCLVNLHKDKKFGPVKTKPETEVKKEIRKLPKTVFGNSYKKNNYKRSIF